MAPPHRGGSVLQYAPYGSRTNNNNNNNIAAVRSGAAARNTPLSRKAGGGNNKSSAAVVVVAFGVFIAAALLAARGALPSSGDAGRLFFLAVLGVVGASFADGSAVRFIVGGNPSPSSSSSSSSEALNSNGQQTSLAPSRPLFPRSLGAMLLGLVGAALFPASFRFGGKQAAQTWAIAARVVGASPAVARTGALAAAAWRRHRRRRWRQRNASDGGRSDGENQNDQPSSPPPPSSPLSLSLRLVALSSWLVPGVIEIAAGSLALGLALHRAEGAAKLSGAAEDVVEAITWPAAVSAASALAAPARAAFGGTSADFLAAGRGPLFGLTVASVCGALASTSPVAQNVNGTFVVNGGGGKNKNENATSSASTAYKYRHTAPSPAVSFSGSIASAAFLVPAAAIVAGGVIGIVAAWVWSPFSSSSSSSSSAEEQQQQQQQQQQQGSSSSSSSSASPQEPSFFLAAAVAAAALISVAAGEPEAGLLAALVAGGCSAELWCRAADADGDAAAFLSSAAQDGNSSSGEDGIGISEGIIVDENGEVIALQQQSSSSNDGGLLSSSPPSPASTLNLPSALEAARAGLDAAWTTLCAPLLYAAVGAAAALTHARASSAAASRGIAGDDGPFPPTRTPVRDVWPAAAAAVAAVVAARLATSLAASVVFGNASSSSSSSTSSSATPPPASPLSAAARAVGQALRANRRGELSAALPPAPFAGLPAGSSPAAAAGSLAAFLAIAVGQLCDYLGGKLVERADVADGVVVVGGGGGVGGGNGGPWSNSSSSSSSSYSPSSSSQQYSYNYNGGGEASSSSSSAPLSSMFFGKKTPTTNGGGGAGVAASVELSAGRGVAGASSSAPPLPLPRGNVAASSSAGPSPRIGASPSASAQQQQQQQQQPLPSVSYYYGDYQGQQQQPPSSSQPQQAQQQQPFRGNGINSGGGGGYYGNGGGSGSYAEVNLQ